MTTRPSRPSPTELAPLLQLATNLALECGEVLRSAGRPRAIEQKSSDVDLVTELDRQVERLIVDRLRAARPYDGLLGEEGATREGTSGVRWLIDPIDGTTNFVYAYPGFAVSIAAEVNGALAVGAVHDVVLQETFAGSLGGGATLNGNPIHVGSGTELSSALVGTGFSYSAAIRGAQSEALRHVLPRVRDIRRRGAASLDLCWVACGRLDAYFERDIGGPWDIGAGSVILHEAGGLLTDAHGGPPRPPHLILASNPGLYEEFRALLVRAHAASD
ncbi:MAG: inositol monophosphatase [Dehalococcoidia bacterium]|nr:inositol monophosphatase [Dehalococcoidia bacterium]